jgi:acyl CoA:acetate/3-ketoacid CoA transferase
MGQMAFRPKVSPDLKIMDERIFRPELMGLGQMR